MEKRRRCGEHVGDAFRPIDRSERKFFADEIVSHDGLTGTFNLGLRPKPRDFLRHGSHQSDRLCRPTAN